MSFLLAGLASGFGQGLVKQAEMNQQRDEAQRDRDFQAALENLRTENNIKVDGARTENDIAIAGTQADLQDLNTKREYGYKLEYDKGKLPLEIQLKQAEGEVSKDVDNNRTRNDLRLTTAKADLDLRNDKASLELRTKLDNGQLTDLVIDDSGNYVGITKDGRTMPTRVKANAVDTTPRGLGDGSALFPPAAAPAPAPAKAAAKPAPAPAKAAPAPAKAPPAQAKTMTRADIKATAAAQGINEEMAKRLLEQRGFKLKD
jgi:hypothetical protein